MALLSSAHNNWLEADHLAKVTYPLFGDPKLLLAIIEKLFLAIAAAMTAVIEHERCHGRMDASGDDYARKLKALRAASRRLGFGSRHVGLATDLQGIIAAHKRSPVEFPRKSRYVICDDDYQMRTLTIEQLRQYVDWTREFIKISEEVMTT